MNESVSSWPRIHERALAALAAAAVIASGCRRAAPAPEEQVGPPGVDCVLGSANRRAVPFFLETSEGEVRCSLDAVRTPRAVAMVTGLAAGRAPFREMTSGKVVRRPYYQGMTFFRAIEGGLVQTGCPVGNGSGHPGYRIPVEGDDSGDASRLAHPGVLFLARYTPPPGRSDPSPPPPGDVIGTQLVVGLTDMSHLAGQVTVLGACGDLDVVQRIARAVARKERRVELHQVAVFLPSDEQCPAIPSR